MYTIISHLFHNAPGAAVKLLSTENGDIKLRTFEDVMIYAHTQGVFYFLYKDKRQFTEYYLKLAEIMRSENRNRWAARCYFKALDEAWRVYQYIAEYGHCYGKDHRERVDPYDLYETARLYMLETGNAGGIKRLKEIHRKHREYADIESQYALLSRRREREMSIEELLDKDINPEDCDCD